MENQADMNGKNYFVCFELFYRTAKELPDDMRLKYYDAVMEYGLYGSEPDDAIMRSLIAGAKFSIDLSNEKRRKKSEYMKGNKNAVKSWNIDIKQTKTEPNRTEQTSTEKTNENKKEENKKKENNKETVFELFRKEYPHARKGKKKDSMLYFSKQNPQAVMQQVAILKWKIKAGLQDAKYIPACERWIRDFTELSDDVVKQDLKAICKWHLTCGGDIKQRATELKQTFGEEQINEIVKVIQQKNKPLF